MGARGGAARVRRVGVAPMSRPCRGIMTAAYEPPARLLGAVKPDNRWG